MEQRQKFSLRLGIEINQQIAAAQQIEFGKRRIFEHVMQREYHHLPDIFVNPKAIALGGEKSLQALRRYVRGDAWRGITRRAATASASASISLAKICRLKFFLSFSMHSRRTMAIE